MSHDETPLSDDELSSSPEDSGSDPPDDELRKGVSRLTGPTWVEESTTRGARDDELRRLGLVTSVASSPKSEYAMKDFR